MQEHNKMDSRQVGGGLKVLKDDNMADQNLNIEHQKHQKLDPGSALQMFLDHIPINSIPGVKISPGVELKTGDTVKDAIQLLYEKNVSRAPIAADVVSPDSTFGRSLDQYMGFVDLVSLVLWSLEEFERANFQGKDNGGDEPGKSNFFTLLEQYHEISHTKVGELAKCFLWDPFFPVNLEDTLFHVLLLLSKHHRLQAVPVVKQSNFQVISYVTQNAVIRLLLQSSVLEWFDGIAEKALSEFRKQRVVIVYGDQSLAEALRILWESRIGAVAVVNRETEKIIGCLRNSDVYLLVENVKLLNGRKSLTMQEFIHMETAKEDDDPITDRDPGALFSAGTLHLKSNFRTRMYSPLTAKRSNTLKQVMNNLAESEDSFCFLVDDSQRLMGMITLRDIIIQFAPPCIDSGIHGGGFFESALEQAGCEVKNGKIICDH